MKRRKTNAEVCVGSTGLAVLLLLGGTTTPDALAKTHQVKAAKIKVEDPTIYDSIIDPNPGNVPSESFEATATAQFGNQVSFGGAARVLDNVVVQLSSWGCQSGSWTGSPSACVTTPG